IAAAAAAPAPAAASVPAASPAGVLPSTRTRRIAAWTLAALVAAAAAALLPHLRRGADAPPAPAAASAAAGTVVLPLEVSGPPDSEWIRLGAMDLIIARLHKAGVPALQSETVLGLLAAGALPGPHRVVRGSADRSGARWHVTLDAR